MPTYVYECAYCAKTFEVEQRITESALTDCHCGSKGTLKRLIQPVAVAFKGSGFHINDYAPSAPNRETGNGKQETDIADSQSSPTADNKSCSGEPSSCPACAPATE